MGEPSLSSFSLKVTMLYSSVETCFFRNGFYLEGYFYLDFVGFPGYLLYTAVILCPLTTLFYSYVIFLVTLFFNYLNYFWFCILFISTKSSSNLLFNYYFPFLNCSIFVVSGTTHSLWLRFVSTVNFFSFFTLYLML